MTFSEREISANRDYFAAKMAAEKTQHSVAQWAAGKPDSGDFLLLDVRDRIVFAQGHIQGALSVPLPELKTFMAQLPKDTEIVTYCAHHY
jgi:rhodanese-related sulfurtransferase